MTQSNEPIAGGPQRHVPVMLNEVLSALKPASGQRFVDGTFGAGGYSSAILTAGSSVLAIDRDPNAIRDGQTLARQSDGHLKLVQGEFSNLDKIAIEHGYENPDGVVLDVGVSSMQIDEAERGFSFQKDGPLDMRMSQEGVSAADVVNQARQQDLTRIIGILGEEKKASRVSGAIVKARESGTIQSTTELAKIVESGLGGRKGDRIHPATRTFQALRIFVNRELEQLGAALFAAERLLKTGGRLVVVTFHSLEDRIVKLFFRDRAGTTGGSRHLPEQHQKSASFDLEGKGYQKVSAAEAEVNPRARSAKLRWGLRTENDCRPEDYSIFGFPRLATLESIAGGGNVSQH